MKNSYTICPQDNLIRSKLVGKISVEDTIAYSVNITTNADFQKGMNSLIDLTDAVFEWHYEEANRYRSFLKSLENVRGECKWAIISQGGITASTARIFKIMNEAYGSKITINLFSNEADALEWLKQK